MATIKVACPKCGQKVSGDESFYGTIVECPICSADILFPGQRRQESRGGSVRPVPPDSSSASSPPKAESLQGKGVPPKTETDAALPSPGANAFPPEAQVEKSVKTTVFPPDEGEDEGMLPPSPIFGAISIVSAVLGVITCVGGILFAPIAIIFGHTALAKARHSPIQPAPGHTLGAIGLMIGYVSLVMTILVLLAATFFGDAIREAIQQAKD